MHLQLESTRDTFNLDDIAGKGTGVQALRGVRGLGLPAVDVQWLEGAGDGATFRGQRVRPRDLDLPLYLLGRDRAHLKELLTRLALMLAGDVTLRLIEDDGTDWSTTVRRVGGGDYTYGPDTTGTTDLSIVVTLRAGDPFWTFSRTTRQIVTAGSGRGLLRRLARLRVSASQAIGTMTLDNIGDAPAYPVWDVHGPGRDFVAMSVTGERLHWAGTLSRDDTLSIDTRTGTVIDGSGVSRYAQLAPAPRMWRIPPGTTTATASMQDTSAGTIVAAGAATATNLVTNPRGETIAGQAAVGQIANSSGVALSTFVATAEGNPGSRFQRWRTLAGSGTATWRVAQQTACDTSRLIQGATYTLLVRMRCAGWPAATVVLALADGPHRTVVMPDRASAVGVDWTDVRFTFTAATSAIANTGLYIALPPAAPTGADGVFDLAWWGVVTGAYTGDFFDGGTPDSLTAGVYDWTGAANASASTQSPAQLRGQSSIACTWQPRRWLVI